MNSADKYALLGDDYHWRWARNKRGPYPRWVHYVLDHLPAQGEGATVLDAGCGDGYPASLLAGRGYQVHGVDPLPSPLSVARKRVPTASFATAYPERAFDYVVALDSIEHMVDRDSLVRAVCQCRRYALISTPPPGADSHAVAGYDLPVLAAAFAGAATVEQLHTSDLHQLFKVTPCA